MIYFCFVVAEILLLRLHQIGKTRLAAQSHGKSIGGVIGLGDGGEAEHLGDHGLHLSFGSFAVAGDGLFDLEGGKFKQGEIVKLGVQQDYSAGLSDGDDSSRVAKEKQLLY